MAADRHLELCKILFWDRERIIICTGLIWRIHANIYYTKMHLEALQASFLLETNVYLLLLVAILDVASRWPQT